MRRRPSFYWHAFGFTEITAYLSTRPAKAVGDASRWEQATASLESALQAESMSYEVDEGGGAFYGPKIDLKVKDAIGREWQMTTIQFDFNVPERFAITYTGEDGQEHQPYMVHRALLGSLERFFGVLIEHYNGAFPLWLAPEQVKVLPLTDEETPRADEIASALTAADYRVGVDRRSERMGAKIRAAQLEKVPYMVIVGPKEVASGELSVRHRADGDLGTMGMEVFMERLRGEQTATGSPGGAANS